MPTPLTPSSSQEIIPISPPRNLKRKDRVFEGEGGTSIAKPEEVKLDRNLLERVAKRVKEQEQKILLQNGVNRRSKGKARERQTRLDNEELSRTQVTSRMLKTLGKDSNPITNSDLYSRTDHFISAATGHQQSNRGGGSAGAATYWEVRNAKMAEQARAKKTDVLSGVIIYINGGTGPKVSNLMLQQMITSNGGRFTFGMTRYPFGLNRPIYGGTAHYSATQNSSCTHIVANGGLSGSKTQKWIDGQGGRGGLKRVKVVTVDWVLDSVEKGKRLSEVGYGVIENPTQKSILAAFGAQRKGEQPDNQDKPDRTSTTPHLRSSTLD